MSDSNIYGGQFCTPDEKSITTIGTGYIANYVSGGSTKQVGATLTNKRIYFSGKVFTFVGRRATVLNRRQIVNVRDVTGTGYDFYRPIHFITLACLSVVLSLLVVLVGDLWGEMRVIIPAIGIILGVAFLIRYFNKKQTLMFIEYAGGNIAFEVKWIQKHEQDNFIRNIHLAKDKLYSMTAAAQGFHANNLESSDEIPEL